MNSRSSISIKNNLSILFFSVAFFVYPSNNIINKNFNFFQLEAYLVDKLKIYSYLKFSS